MKMYVIFYTNSIYFRKHMICSAYKDNMIFNGKLFQNSKITSFTVCSNTM